MKTSILLKENLMKRRYKNIRYILIRSKRKTFCIQIERDGQVTFRAPLRTSIKQVEGIIEKKRSWITRHLLEWREVNARRKNQVYLNGEPFPYLGKSYPLKIVKNQSAPLLLKAGSFCLRSDQRDTPKASDAFKLFYQEKGIKRIGERVTFFKKKAGVEVKRIRMVETKTRWASCSSLGNLNFHWKCLMLPGKVLDYIVVHELAHLKEMNHSSRFWKVVEKALPDYKERRDWLRAHEMGFDL